jgi:hypothetical protein
LTSLQHIFQNERVTSEKLDALSLEELYVITDRIGLDLPPGLERIFVLEELLEALDEDSKDRRAPRDAAVHVEEKKFCCRDSDDLDSALSPTRVERRYNETIIRAIVRDPSWAFAFWDLADAERFSPGTEDNTAKLFLRVTELAAGADEGHREYYDIPVAGEDFQWYINLPRPGVCFRIDLCARDGAISHGRTRVLARSNDVAAPRQTLSSPAKEIDARGMELLVLSGIDDLHIESTRDINPQRILQEDFDREPFDGR